MTKLGIASLSVSGLLIVGSFFMMALTKAERQNPQIRSNAVNIQEVPRHPVSEQMQLTADNLAKSQASDFQLPTTSGKDFHLLDQLQKKPVLIVMTKDGCPCSIEAQPFYTALATNYADRLTTIGVIDADKVGALKYKEGLRPGYEIAYTTTTDLFEKYKSKQSVYTYLINQDGTLRKVFPGYSRASLVELNDILHDLTGLPRAELDLTMAPEKMTSGCFFFTEVGADKPSW